MRKPSASKPACQPMFELLEPRLLLSSDTELIGLDLLRATWPSLTGDGQTVAVIDTGLNYNHPGFSGNIWTNPGETAGNGIDDDGNGYVDDVHGYDFYSNDGDPFDDNGHGTNVAGIIASSGTDAPGVAPGAHIIALKALGATGGSRSGVIADALQWVVDNREAFNITAVNLSLRSLLGNFTSFPGIPVLNNLFPDWFTGGEESKLEALDDAGVVVCAAAGNDFFAYNSEQGLCYPAISPHTVSVGAVWSADKGDPWGLAVNDQGNITYHNAASIDDLFDGPQDYVTDADLLTSFSQRWSGMDLLAPGGDIISLGLGIDPGTLGPDDSIPGTPPAYYLSMSGTSQATPFVTGASMLVRQALHDFLGVDVTNKDQIIQILKDSADHVTDTAGSPDHDNVTNTNLTFDRLNIYSAIQYIINQGDLTDDLADGQAVVNGSFVAGNDREYFTFQGHAGDLVRLQLTAGFDSALAFFKPGQTAQYISSDTQTNDFFRYSEDNEGFLGLWTTDPTQIDVLLLQDGVYTVQAQVDPDALAGDPSGTYTLTVTKQHHSATRQQVYLDFSGLSASQVAAEFPGLSGDPAVLRSQIISATQSRVQSIFSAYGVDVYTYTPAGNYSTISFQAAGIFDPGNDVLGQADGVDYGNLNPNDDAVVYWNHFAPEMTYSSSTDVGTAFGTTAAHLIGMLVGLRHVDAVQPSQDLMGTLSSRNSLLNTVAFGNYDLYEAQSTFFWVFTQDNLWVHGKQDSAGILATTVGSEAVADISPGSGPVGSYIRILGKDFGDSVGSVKFGGTTASEVEWTDSTIHCRVPQGAFSGEVTVQKPLYGSEPIPVGHFEVTDPVVIYVDGGNTTRLANGTALYPFSKIQRGVDASNNGDTVIVAPGEYVEHVSFGAYMGHAENRKDIVLTSSNPNDPGTVSRTVINGGNDPEASGYPQSPGPTVDLTGRETAACVLAGFTITGGHDTSGYGDPGGGIEGMGMVFDRIEWLDGVPYVVYIESNSNATIRNCVITRNSGGGVSFCEGRVEDCSITRNTAGSGLEHCWGEIVDCSITHNTAEYGGGLKSCNGTIRDCIISQNTATYGGGGLANCWRGTITGCAISDNTAAYGGGFYSYDMPITRCIVQGNTASQYGGGLYRCAGDITECTVSGNTASYGGGLYDCEGNITECTIEGNSAARSGGGLYGCDGLIAECAVKHNDAVIYGGGIYNSGTLTLTNSTVSGNSARYGGGILNDGDGGTLQLANSTVSGNTASEDGGGIDNYGTLTLNNSIVAVNTAGGDGQDVYGSFSGSHNLVGVDPGFVRNPFAGPDGTWGTADDDYGDLRLLQTSPAVDAGGNALLPTDEFDLDGDGDTTELLPIDLAGNPRVVNTVVDIGAYEFVAPGDANADGKVDSADLAVWQRNYDPLGLHQNTFEMGNWDGDNDIDSADLAIWQRHYNPLGLSESLPLLQVAANDSLPTPLAESIVPIPDNGGVASPEPLMEERIVTNPLSLTSVSAPVSAAPSDPVPLPTPMPMDTPQHLLARPDFSVMPMVPGVLDAAPGRRSPEAGRARSLAHRPRVYARTTRARRAGADGVVDVLAAAELTVPLEV